jgi:hypothetical protein
MDRYPYIYYSAFLMPISIKNITTDLELTSSPFFFGFLILLFKLN